MRAPVPADAPAVLAVITARDMADLGSPDYTLGDLRDEWGASEFDLAADALVVEAEDGVIAAYAVVRRPGTFALVAPEYEGRGIGARVLRWAEKREREQGRTHHRQWVAGNNRRGEALLRDAGYVRARSYWRMVRPLGRVAEEGSLPPGLRVRELDVDQDAAALHALDAASFAASPDYQPESFVAFSEEHLGAHDLDTQLSCVAEDGERIVGFLIARRWQEEAAGFVDILAVHPDQQGRGIGTAMLQRTFAGFAGAGLREAQLGVASDNPGALKLYERVGMTARFRFDTYERPVS
jgi:mycothiol synthase